MVLCSCKVKNCDRCGECSKCGCDHDGVSVQVKMSRKRGRPNGSKSKRRRQQRPQRLSAAAIGSFAENNEPCHDDEIEMVYPLHLKGVNMLDLRKTFGLPASSTAHVPSASVRGDTDLDFLQLESRHVKALVNVVQKCLIRVCEVLCPGNPSGLVDATLENLSAIRGKLTKTSSEKVAKNLVWVNELLGPHSLQRRALFSMLAQSFSRKQLQALMREVTGEDEMVVGVERFSRGRRDFDRLFLGQELVKTFRSHHRFREETLRQAILYVFKPEHVKLLSWGTHVLDVNGKSCLFPAVMRCRRRTVITKQYLDTHADPKNRIGASSMMKVLNLLTKKELKAKTAVDVVYCTLILEPMAILRRLVSGEVPGSVTQKTCLLKVEAIERFFKVWNNEILMFWSCY